MQSAAAPKAVQKKKQEHVEGGDIDFDSLGIVPHKPKADAMDTRDDGAAESQSQAANGGDESATEDEEDVVAAPPSNGAATAKPSSPQKPSLPSAQQRTPSPSPEPVHRIIGTDYPMRDFRKNLKTRGDIVSTLVAELGMVVQETVLGAFASRRHNEMVECLRLYRDTALRVRGIDCWGSSDSPSLFLGGRDRFVQSLPPQTQGSLQPPGTAKQSGVLAIVD